ncbi:hypothetical protein M885DRAFT_541712 [Pelagophyceae sp. CCMP2097]|nr:hypothetical protein M885DRAFT_541712 [Pelagophyceae sp. CCMP2097]
MARGMKAVAVAMCSNRSMATPSAAGTCALISACDAELWRCAAAADALRAARDGEAAREHAARPWRREARWDATRHQLITAKALELEVARAAVATGSWTAFRERQEWLRLAAERGAMAWEDGFSRVARCAAAAAAMRADYEVYVNLVAQFGVPFCDADYDRLCPRAGEAFQRMCDAAAARFQRMHRARAPLFKWRRRRAATRIQTLMRARAARRRWVPVLSLRRQVGVARPLRFCLGHWRRCAVRTRRARQLVRKVKYGRAAAILQAWRALCGDCAASAAVEVALAAVVEETLAFALDVAAAERAANVAALADDVAGRAAKALLDFIVSRK